MNFTQYPTFIIKNGKLIKRTLKTVKPKKTN